MILENKVYGEFKVNNEYKVFKVYNEKCDLSDQSETKVIRGIMEETVLMVKHLL